MRAQIPPDPRDGGLWPVAALEQLDEAVIVGDAAGRVAFLNRAAAALIGWSAAEAVGGDPREVLRLRDGRDGADVASPVGRVLREGRPLAFTATLVPRAGAEVRVEGRATPVRDAAGATSHVVVVLDPAASERGGARAPDESEESFRLLVASTTDYAIFLLDASGRVRTWNPGAERIKGWRREEIVGRHFSAFYPRDAVEAGWPETELRLAEERGRFEDEGWRVRKDGSRFWANVVITALRDDAGRLRGFSKITRDLTERRASEEAIRAREERFRAVAESSSDGIVIVDDAGRIVFWNTAATRLFGHPEVDARGAPFTLVLPERTHESFRREFERMRERDPARVGGRSIETAGRHRDGHEFPLEIGVSTWRTEDGQRLWCATLRDVTERRQLERARARAEAMAELDRRKDEFLAMLSHELRNPLAPIRNAVDLLRTRTEDPVQRQARAIVERQVGQLTRIVEDLLEVSRFTTGSVRLRREPLDLRRVVERAVETVRPSVDEHRHALEVALPPEPVPLVADPTRLEQAVVNLVSNAAKYTNDGGHISVALRQEAGVAVLRVRDDGVGIAADLLPRVFDLFTQATRSLDRSQGGLGVGLTVVKRIVELHGGTVEARSAGPGRGSEFVVRLRTEAPSAADAADRAPPPADSASAPLRVLVVDDNRDAADTAAMLLRGAGHDVLAVYDGRSAFDAVLSFRPHTVLLDIGLPGMDGYEVAQRIRAHDEVKHTRLLAVSGYGQEADRQRSRAAGFDEHLVKPVEPRKVLEKLR